MCRHRKHRKNCQRFVPESHDDTDPGPTTGQISHLGSNIEFKFSVRDTSSKERKMVLVQREGEGERGREGEKERGKKLSALVPNTVRVLCT